MTTTYSVHRDYRADTRECVHCLGSGQVLEPVEVAFDWFEDQASKCPRCKGSGKAGRR